MANCMKCGVELPEEHAFCDSCLQVMEQYPIAPGTPVNILSRPVSNAGKNGKRKRQTHAETIRKLRRQLKNLFIITTILFTLVCVLIGALYYLIWGGGSELLQTPEVTTTQVG